MDFVSFEFYVFLAVVVAAYYIMPLRYRWIVLLAGSLSYYILASQDIRSFVIFLLVIIASWALGRVLDRFCWMEEHSEAACRCLLAASILLVAAPLLISRFSPVVYALESLLRQEHTGILVSLGLSFFTMQIIAYLADIYLGRIEAQRNLFKYMLFVSFFPQILQGPIPRYEILEPQLIQGHRFDETGFVKGFMRILWGFFLKLMIADRAGIVVDEIFGSYAYYQGGYVLVAGVLYSIQLYADFLACVTLAQGIAELFGIHLSDNFRHPYMAVSIRDFWGRWHISLSLWLRDYIYIPLGGNRRGKVRRYVNLVITFAVSGIWHGAGIKYIFWGLMHAAYQIAGELTGGIRDRIYGLAGLENGRRLRIWIGRAFTCFFAMLAWIVFRADTLGQGIYMIRSLFAVHNPWIFFSDALLELGLDWREWVLLGISILILAMVSAQQEKGVVIRDVILRQPAVFRWGLYLLVIAVVLVFGSYGYGYNAADFIYGNF